MPGDELYEGEQSEEEDDLDELLKSELSSGGGSEANKQRSRRRCRPNHFYNQVPEDQAEILKRQKEISGPVVARGLQICPNRFEQEFFSEKKGDRGLDAGMEESLAQVLLASAEYRQDGNTALLETRVHKGLTDYTEDQYNMAKELTDKHIQKDLKEGNVSRYMLKIMREPKLLPHDGHDLALKAQL